MSVSKRARYEILRRDNYTCRYCHATDAPLTIDHVVPVALGGTDDPGNLVAACKDCNAGKTSTNPDAPLVAQINDDAIRWALAMRQAANQALEDLAEDEWFADELDTLWSEWYCGTEQLPIYRPANWRDSISAWRAAGMPCELLLDSARKALGNDRIHADDTWKYFCGIAWRRISEMQEVARGLVH